MWENFDSAGHRQIDSLAQAGQAVESLGFKLSSAPMEFHDGKIKISRLRKIDSKSNEVLILDFLLVTEETAKAWESRRDIEWEGRKLRVVSPEGLILLKQLRRSGMDLDDIDYLRSIKDED